jgi:hypothetical protein
MDSGWPRRAPPGRSTSCFGPAAQAGPGPPALLIAAANLDHDTISESIANSAAFNRDLCAMLGLMTQSESESEKTAARPGGALSSLCRPAPESGEPP